MSGAAVGLVVSVLSFASVWSQCLVNEIACVMLCDDAALSSELVSIRKWYHNDA